MTQIERLAIQEAQEKTFALLDSYPPETVVRVLMEENVLPRGLCEALVRRAQSDRHNVLKGS